MSDPRFIVIEGDSLPMMRAMADGAVDAIVTSPPYADQRVYEEGEVGRGQRIGVTPGVRRTRARSRAQRSNAPAEWVQWIEPYTAEMLRVLTPAGSIMLNLGVVLRDGEEHPCTDDIIRGCRAQGWKILHRLVWHKPNGQVPSAPGYLTIGHEFVAWMSATTAPWRAHEQPPGSQASREVRTPHAASSLVRINSLYSGAGAHRKQSKIHALHPDGARPATVLTYPVGGEANPDAHPARMPLKLAQQLVAMCCPPGGLVLDPFCGNATTGVAANRIGRRFVGIEIDPAYVVGARRRLADDDPLVADAEPEPEQLVFAP